MSRYVLHSAIARNAVSLYITQIANYIVPLLLVPYLVRVLGPEGYGTVAFAQGFVNYLTLFVEYGFNWSATRRISVTRSSLVAVNRLALHVWAAKGLLSLLGGIVLVMLIAVVPQLKEISLLLLILYGMVLGNTLFPTWLFQGMERMVIISIINLGVKLFVLVGVFALVRRPEHTLLYAALMGLGWLLAGVIGMLVAIHIFHLRVMKISWAGIFEVLRDGWVLFLSKASVSLYTAGNAFILGMLTDHTVVGYYSAAEKLVKSVLGLLGPISQAVYPRFSKLAVESEEMAMAWSKRMLFLMGCAGGILSSGIFASASLITRILLGAQYAPSIAVMRILAPIIFLIALSNVLGIQIMLPFGRDRVFTLILFSAGVINVGLALVFAPLWQASGMAAAVLISELFVTTAMFIYLKSQGVDIL